MCFLHLSASWCIVCPSNFFLERTFYLAILKLFYFSNLFRVKKNVLWFLLSVIYLTLNSHSLSGAMALLLRYSAAVSYALSVLSCWGQDLSRKPSCKGPWTPKLREPFSSRSGTISRSAQSNAGQNISQATSNERGPTAGSKELALQVGSK